MKRLFILVVLNILFATLLVSGCAMDSARTAQDGSKTQKLELVREAPDRAEGSSSEEPQNGADDTVEKAMDPAEDNIEESVDIEESIDVAIVDLPAVEVREYKGEKLDAADSFRENSIAGPQEVDTAGYNLDIVGLVDKKMSYTYEEVISHNIYRKVVRLYCVEGWDRNILWEGVLLKDIFAETGVNPEANTVIFHAEDGYTTSLPLDYIIENDIMIAYKQNNITLLPENGFPFQLVAEDKYGFKWIKWLTKIELSDDADYEGFWESRGYDNDADVGGPIRG